MPQLVYAVLPSSSFFSPTQSSLSPFSTPFHRTAPPPTVQYTFSPVAALHELHGAWSWAYVSGGNFYHVLAEVLPAFVVAARLFHKYRKYLIPATGAQACGTPSRALWHTIRSRHFLHPDSLPLFNPDWTYRDLPPLTDARMALLPADWVVVLAKRPGKKRAIINFAELESAVKRIFPDRVVTYNGSMGILEARDLFRRARLYIGGHGAALANMVFMSAQATVLEIRPNGCPNACFHQLSYACSLRYDLVLSDGICYSAVTPIRSSRLLK
ncbi:unnamed protein product [Closterium sp. NIES-54]